MIMKHLVTVLIALLALSPASHTQASKTQKNKKVLVVYFSATNTTKKAAEKIATATHGDLCAIEPVQAYSSADLDWRNKQSRSSVEMKNAKSRPQIKKIKHDLKQYDVVFLGFPIWWDLAPRCINSFIEGNNLKGKTIVPFATSGSGGITNSVKELKKTYPSLSWKEGKILNESTPQEIKAWANKW